MARQTILAPLLLLEGPVMNNCAVDYYPTSFATSGPALMGLNAANEGWLGGFFRHGVVDRFYAHVRRGEEFQDFQTRLAKIAGPERPAEMIAAGRPDQLARVGCLIHPFPGFGPLAWVRRFLSCRAYSLCGITHTTATTNVMDSIGNLLVAPIQRWDAVICTSSVVRNTYDRVIAHWCDYLEDRFGRRPEPTLELPIIPLGVDCAAFAPSERSQQLRAALRGQLKIAADDIVVLYVGRLNPTAKVHPLPSFLALEQAAQRTKARLWFVQAGWFANDRVRDAYQKAAEVYAPSVRHVFLDGRRPEIRAGVWPTADIFLSLSDNLQETFGLTPIEAMAAGLPVVVSDWDGYRDTVRHGVDGFRVPIWMPENGDGEDLALGFATTTLSYELYTGVSSQLIGVDLAATVEALVSLIQEPELRQRMGAAGRERARERFDWQVVIRAYQELWQELAQIRSQAAMSAPRGQGRPAFPLRADPFDSFASYPTRTIEATTTVTLSGLVGREAVADLRASPLNNFAQGWIGSPALGEALIDRLGQGPATIAELVEVAKPASPIATRRTIAWLHKMGVVAFPPVAAPADAAMPGA